LVKIILGAEKIDKSKFGMKVVHVYPIQSQQLVNREFPFKEYLFKAPEPGKRFSYIVVEPEVIYDKYRIKISQKKGDYMEYVNVSSPESLTKALNCKKKSKKKKSKDIKGLDEDEIANVKDEESQKYIKDLRDDLKKDEVIISHLWKDATTHAEKICSGISEASMTRPSGISTRYNDYLNALDRIVNSTRLKLSDLLLKLSKLNVDYRNAIYELIVQ
ncbi:2061_t:CDS:2, partial [Diversispora eburnea]